MLPPGSLAILVPFLLLSHVIYNYVRNPLRKIPAAHPLAHFTSLWIHTVRWRRIENTTLKAAHDRLGPIVCLGPEEISVNCVKGGIREIYSGGFEKSKPGSGGYNWYSFFSNYDGTDNMFSIGSNKVHSARKRMMSNIYSKSVIMISQPLLAQITTIMYDRFLPYLESTSRRDKGVMNIYALLSASTMDIVNGYLFGLGASSNLIDNPEQLEWFLGLYNSRRSYSFWPQEFPGFSSFVEKWLGYRFAPKWVDDANEEIEKWSQRMCDKARGVLAEGDMSLANTPVVYQQLLSNFRKQVKAGDIEEAGVTRLLASEVLDHLAAGFDTSGITLTYVVHELSRRKDVQSRLQEELRTLSPVLSSASSPTLPDSKSLDALPFLHAVLWETLRLHPAIPGPQPRFTPPQGCCLGPEEQPYYVPSGVRVSASAGLLHANEEVYERATEWWPERWLDIDRMDGEKRKDMESRWFWAFGSGGRMCVGSHLAVYQMKYIVAALYSNYKTSIVDDTGIGQADSYTAPPQNDRLMIRLEKLEDLA